MYLRHRLIQVESLVVFSSYLQIRTMVKARKPSDSVSENICVKVFLGYSGLYFESHKQSMCEDIAYQSFSQNVGQSDGSYRN
jgi:hypothetical protein